jgi:hypothetical protein
MKRSSQEYEYVTVISQDESSFFSVFMVLVGYDVGQPANKRIKMLLNISLLLHLFSLVATIVSWKGGCLLFTNACFEAHDRPQSTKSFMYSFYRPTITGDRNKAYDLSPVPAASFTHVLEDAYADTCVDGSSPPHLLKLRAAFENTTHPSQDDVFTLTWMPTVVSFFWMDEANGYVYLAFMFGISLVFQLVSLQQANRNNDNFFETPCSWRWLEYALTSPMAVILVASALMQRDVNTLTLLSVAQAACVQFGFAVEYALADFDSTQADSKAIDFQEVTALPVDKCPQTWPHQRNRLWWFSFLASGALHITIWHMLISHFIHTSGDTDCLQTAAAREQSDTWRNAMIVVLAGQCISFTLFGIVPVYQAYELGILPWKPNRYADLTQEQNVRRVMRKGFEIYTILSCTAKFTLGVTYIAFVRLFPFYTVSSALA